MTQIQARAASEIESALAGLGLAAERPQPGSYLVRLEGQHKLATMTWLIVGALCVVTVALWALVASFFTLHA